MRTIPERSVVWVLLFFLLLAAVWDFFLRRVPNVLVLLFLLCRFPLCRDVPSGMSCAADGLFILLILIPLWRRQMIGGGDVKILAVTGMYAGLRLWFSFFFFSLILAGAGGLFRILLSGTFRSRIQYFSEYIRTGGLRRGHPYEGPEREQAELPFLPFLFLGALLGCWWGGVL